MFYSIIYYIVLGSGLMIVTRLTTEDNPYDPVTDFDRWYEYDESKGYCTSGLINRLAITTQDQSEVEQEAAIDEAIDSILEMYAGGLYKKVIKTV